MSAQKDPQREVSIIMSVCHTECSPKNGEMASAGGAIHHTIMQNIPEIWHFPQQSVILQHQTITK